MRRGVEIIENTRLIVRLKAETSYLSNRKSSASSELIPENSSLFNVKMVVIFTEFIGIFTLNKNEFSGMSSDDAELFCLITMMSQL